MLATCGADGLLKIFDLRTGSPANPMQVFKVSPAPLSCSKSRLEGIHVSFHRVEITVKIPDRLLLRPALPRCCAATGTSTISAPSSQRAKITRSGYGICDLGGPSVPSTSKDTPWPCGRLSRSCLLHLVICRCSGGRWSPHHRDVLASSGYDMTCRVCVICTSLVRRTD
jgi:hypothetical protein